MLHTFDVRVNTNRLSVARKRTDPPKWYFHPSPGLWCLDCGYIPERGTNRRARRAIYKCKGDRNNPPLITLPPYWERIRRA